MDPVEEIKDRIPIDELVGQYVDLKRSGASYKGLCPFHAEKTPSFYVSPSRGTFHCFGCGRGGDVFSFLMESERLTFAEALQQLAQQARVELPRRDRQSSSLRDSLYAANEAAARFFRTALETAQGKRAVQYLHERGFGSEAIERFNLGYAPEGRDALATALRGQGIEDRILLAAGLALQDDVGGPARDRFRGRLIFPIKDVSGRITGFGGRALGDVQPKYLNSPQTEVFDKSSALYGLDLAADSIRQAGRAVLVEGYLDAVRAHMGGYAFTVASLGTAVTPKQLAALARYSQTVVVALDPDPAGQAAAGRTSLTALAEVTRARGRADGQAGALDLRIARLPDGHGDPDELIRDHPDLWDASLAASVPAFEFVFTTTMAGLDRTASSWRQEAVDKLLPLIQEFSGSAGWQATWVQRLAAETGIDPAALRHALPAGRSRPRRMRGRSGDSVSGMTSRALTADPAQEVERALVALLLQIVVVPHDSVQSLQDAPLSGVYRTIVDRLIDWRTRANYDYEMFRETLPADVLDAADELRALEAPLPEEGKLGVAVAFHLARLRQFRLQERLARARTFLSEIGADDQAGAVAGLAALMGERRQVEQDLDRLSLLTVQSGTVRAQGTMDQDSGSR